MNDFKNQLGEDLKPTVDTNIQWFYDWLVENKSPLLDNLKSNLEIVNANIEFLNEKKDEAIAAQQTAKEESDAYNQTYNLGLRHGILYGIEVLTILKGKLL